MTAARVIPRAWVDLHRPQRMIERSLMVYRRTWLIVVSGFFEPLFYLMTIRLGFAALVGDVEFGGRFVEYADFVAPALMAASAMNGALFDATANTFYKLKNARTYEAVLATPMTTMDVALGEIGWAVMRAMIYSVAFFGTMSALGMTSSAWAVLSIPISALIGFTFAALGIAVTTYMRSWDDLDYVTTASLPLFLFSATFYPLANYGDWGWVVQLSPLYHGVALIRAVTFGDLGWAMLAHVGVLVALTLVGLAISARRIQRMLLP